MKKIMFLVLLILFGVNAHARTEVPDCMDSYYDDVVMDSLKSSDEYLRGHKVLLKVQRTAPEVTKVDVINEAAECNVVMRMSNTRGTTSRMFVHQYRMTYKTQDQNDRDVFVETTSFKRL
ncbi:hypothetical protein OND84_000489 [Morganella morganii]|uniref:hypothetical protein n=1 Tax=Morganella morganii TaxID=582 RepID=UPI002ADEA255|nr:hypothetical protein [Morganella morganii]